MNAAIMTGSAWLEETVYIRILKVMLTMYQMIAFWPSCRSSLKSDAVSESHKCKD